MQATLQKILRPDASVISTLAQLKHPVSNWLARSARGIHRNIQIQHAEPDDSQVAQYLAGKPAILQRLNRDLEHADFGILDMQIVQGLAGPLATFRHSGLGGFIPIMLESNGTRRFMRIYPLLAQSLEDGAVVLADELDQALHPLLLAEVVRWFHDPERNPRNAQLWMTCQASTLLDELRKEEVFLCEKDANGRSRVFGLRDVQGVRRDENLSRKYLGGVYGAVPHLG